MPQVSCIWCGKSAPQVEPSREHVLPDYMGVRLMLTSGVVCKPCNNTLNALVDMPLKKVFQPLLTHFNIASSKRESLAKASVAVSTNLGVIPGVMLPGGRVEVSSKRLDQVSDETDAIEQWVATEGELPGLLERMKARAKSVEIIQVQKILYSRHTARFLGKGRALIAAGVKATLNYLAFIELENAYRPSLDAAKHYVTSGVESGVQLPACASQPLIQADSGLTVSDFRPEHSIIVEATPGRSLIGELRIFGDAFVRVEITRAWDGPTVALQQTFTPEQRS